MEFRYNRWANCWEIVDFAGCEIMDIKITDVREIASLVMDDLIENDLLDSDYIVECVIEEIDNLIYDKTECWSWNIENHSEFLNWLKSYIFM